METGDYALKYVTCYRIGPDTYKPYILTSEEQFENNWLRKMMSLPFVQPV